MIAPLAALLALAASAAADAGDDVIIVTASRTGEARAASPAPVAVMDAGEIERLGAQHVSEALNRMPGVMIHRGNGAEHLTAIRSPVLTGGAGAGSFLYLEDGVGLRAPGFANVNGLFEAADDLAGRIEVIRGPGPAQYGSNALHGLVNVISADPRRSERLAEAEIGEYGRARVRLTASGPNDIGAGFVGLSVRTEQGWRDDAGLMRAALQGRLDGDAGAASWSLRGALIHLDQDTATFVQGEGSFRDRALARRNPNPEAFRRATAVRLALHGEQEFAPGLTGQGVVYARANTMNFLLHFLPSRALERTGHSSLGAQTQLIADFGATRLSAGIDAELTRGYLYEFQSLPTQGPFVQGLHYDYQVDALVLAGFMRARHALTENLRVEAGARLETTRYDYDNRAPDGVIGRYFRPADRSDSYTTFAPSAGLVWEPAEGWQAFARAARGVRAPQTDELYRLQPGQEIDTIRPETLDSLEAGLRRSWTGGRVELTGFVMEKANVFFRDADGFNVTDGATRHRGLELDASLDLTPTLKLAGALTWARHTYAFDRPLTNLSEVIADGARVDTAPDWLANARLIWSPFPAFEGEAEWVHVGGYWADAGNTARYDGHDLLHLRARWSVREGVELFAALRNALDARYAERADFAFGDFRYFPGEPRQLSVGVRVRG
ncbi:TonB-dependent receptor [Alkalicaulis satelles]|uniref:TonB-dependent receptor n=1 Tax=Alkalicaulis satelles TaxID=2609175 RepID=A0A5M6ZJE6_9PROT|nr:TonB-dependent receptor [Alkalicaulis satelles]KAA5804460.1 TonB-dependent receptor [Alkalicaulis satelles]